MSDHPRTEAATRKAVADGVADSLREDIILNRLPSGTFLREADLARHHDVSRGPVREALKQLEREGLVVSHRNKGFAVAALTMTDIEDIYELRLSLETLAARLACRRRTFDDLASMARTLDELADLGPNARPLPMAVLDVRFHREIYAAAHHTRLMACWKTMESQVFKAMVSRNVTERLFSEVFVAQHQNIRALIAARNEDAAVAAIETHLREAYDRLKAQADEADTDG
ncbi:transcriptional regulator, GntR family protein [Oceanicola granulosus HTCC2516]|uniref:Transcriptional regulator, GntR family protein n=1 Tax=Oceanicola granulosus (strain ATCC BAA-861 / DSM 15982 / KCTC 12143 / HTCC2516) TaxID=314256 RepID=Q2CEF8_OCEGH|nr:GntR family transcriptional regulator [Oceanicola granulosus]EAR51039.1 transcriptional regulator, GntR family protein [Oceanicola granulosus HTCC2516]